MTKTKRKRIRAKKGGRPRKQGVAREPNGQVSRRKADVDAVAFQHGPMQPVLQARRTHAAFAEVGDTGAAPVSYFGTEITKAEAQRNGLLDRGSVLGRMVADSQLDRDLAQVGFDFAALRQRYRSTNGLPGDNPAGSSWGASRGPGVEDLEEALRCKEAYFTAHARIARHGTAVVNAMMRACVHEQPARAALVEIGCKAVRGGK